MENQVARRFLGLSQAEWRLWVKWVLVTTVIGFLGVVGLTFGVMAGVGNASVLAVVFGVLVGTAQWMLLRQRVPQAGQWVLATAVGWIVCALVNLGAGGIMMAKMEQSVSVGVDLVVIWSVIVVLLGAVIGTAQWMFLRKRVYRAGWWVLATAMAWGLGWGLGWGLFALIARRMQLSGDFVTFPTSIAVAVGITVGATTGYVLNVLLRHPISAAPEPQREANTR